MTAWVAVLALLAPPPETPVRFEPAGLRVDGALVADPRIQLKEASAGLLLVSRACVEPLAAPVSVLLAPGREVVVEPGVRLTRTEAGFELTAHLKKKVAIRAGAETFEIPCPALVTLADKGWLLGVGRPLDVPSIVVAQAQDEVDKTLQDLQKDKEKLQQPKPQDTPAASSPSKPAFPYVAIWPEGTPRPPWFPSSPPAVGAGVPPLYYFFFAQYFDPYTMAQAADSQVILTHEEVSPTGF